MNQQRIISQACILPILMPIACGQTVLTTAQIARRVSPAVVVIQGKTDSGDSVLGSGFIISKDGKVVTNLHIIRDLKDATIQLPSGDMSGVVSVLATDERHDLAILQIFVFSPTADPKVGRLDTDLPFQGLGNSDVLTVGERVVVVGSPLGLDATVTAGILSAIRHSGDGSKLLQTDAAVNHGNSGGPLVNSNGLAVGVVSSIVRSDSAQGLNFAIPINYVHVLLNNLHEAMTLEQMRRGLGGTRPPNQQSSGPSLKETLDWLEEIVSRGVAQCNWRFADGSTVSGIEKGVVWKADSCTTEMGIVTASATLVQTRRFTIPLGIISGASVQRMTNGQCEQKYWLRLTTSLKGITSVLSYSVSSGAVPTGKAEIVDVLLLPFNDESTAQRATHGFLHAAELCRKKEPF